MIQAITQCGQITSISQQHVVTISVARGAGFFAHARRTRQWSIFYE